jgi:hypothetical protein
MPEISAVLFTDQPVSGIPYFDHVNQISDPQFSSIDKIAPLKNSPFERTLFLDSDTYVIEPLEELFDLLDRFDIAAAHDTWRLGVELSECPDSFVEFNSGVLLYRLNEKVKEFIDSWENQHKKNRLKVPYVGDQVAFRKCVFYSTVSVYVLPPEYNYNMWFPSFFGVNGKVKILHGRNNQFQQAARIVNQSQSARVFLPSAGYLTTSHFNIFTSRGSLLAGVLNRMVKVERGIKRLLKKDKTE